MGVSTPVVLIDSVEAICSACRRSRGVRMRRHGIDDGFIQNRQRDVLTYRQSAQHGLAVPILGYESEPRRLGVADAPKGARLSVEFKRPGLQRLSPGHHG